MAGLQREDLKKELDWYSSSISTVVRTTGFGVIAGIWALFTADGLVLADKGLFGVSTEIAVRFSFICASGALFCDIVQYVSAYWMTSIGYSKFETKLEVNNSEEFYYTKEYLGGWGKTLYSLVGVFFVFKLIFAVGAALSFVFLVFGVSPAQ